MEETVRKLVEAGMEAFSSSRERAERLASLVGREVRKQLRTMGIVTREELSELKKRVRQLERQVGKRADASPADAASRGKKAGTTATPKRSAKRGTARRAGS